MKYLKTLLQWISNFFKSKSKPEIKTTPMTKEKEPELHPHPFNGTNNKKRTLRRLRVIAKTQSIPIWKKDKNGIQFLGYKYIEHLKR